MILGRDDLRIEHPGAVEDTIVPSSAKTSWLRIVFAIGLCAALVVAIARTTAPGPIAAFSPDLALWFNPSHPSALIAKAENLRERFVEATVLAQRVSVDADAPVAARASTPAPEGEAKAARRPRIDRTSPEAGGGRFASPIIVTKGGEPANELAELRDEIATIVRKAIAGAPLSARAHRLLAEVTTDRNDVRRLMTRAAVLSPRETLALAWLLADAADRKDLAVMVDNGDKIMRTRPDLVPAMGEQLAVAVESPEGRKLLVERMGEDPAWREAFLRVSTKHAEKLSTMLALFADIAASATPPTISEVRSLIADLLNREEPTLAHQAWRLLVPRSETSRQGELHNEGFDSDFSGYAFDWEASVVQGASVDQVATEISGKALRVSFDGSRVRGLTVRQAMMLANGSYRVSGKYKGWLAGNRGLRWQVRCLYGTREVLGQTELLSKTDGSWEDFDFAFEVIDIDACKAQTLILIHDARSASEEVVSGEMQFDTFSVAKISQMRPVQDSVETKGPTPIRAPVGQPVPVPQDAAKATKAEVTSEPGKTEPRKTEPRKPEPSKSEPSKTDPGKASARP